MTGATGFIGTHLIPRLRARGHEVVTLSRDRLTGPAIDLDADSSREDWARGLETIQGIIHLAAIAHRAADADELEQVNVRWPLTLFEAAGEAGVTGFVFVSSIKVFGDVSARPFRVDDPHAPDDAYGRSKSRAEAGLEERQRSWPQTRLAVLRPPLVYGPGVKANFHALLRWAGRGRRGIPLPFGAARAPRSVISVANLCDALIAGLGRSGVFHCADAGDLSVHDMMRMLGVPGPRLIPLPVWLMRGALTLSGHSGVFDRLYRPLQLECEPSQHTLGWMPAQSSEDALAELLAESNS